MTSFFSYNGEIVLLNLACQLEFRTFDVIQICMTFFLFLMLDKLRETIDLRVFFNLDLV